MAKKRYDLELSRVLYALDTGDRSFYASLTPEEQKAYVPLILMRWMSALGDQNRYQGYAIISTNDIVNLRFWQLSKHPELQHLLLCLTGLKSKQYHLWINNKTKGSKTKAVDAFLRELHPGINRDELSILRNSHDKDSFKELCYAAGKSDQETKQLVEEFKKVIKDGRSA